jgi:hypothetical protein
MMSVNTSHSEARRTRHPQQGAFHPAHAEDGVDEQGPEGREEDQHHRRLVADAEEQQRQRDERDRREAAEHLDGPVGQQVQPAIAADQQPQRHGANEGPADADDDTRQAGQHVPEQLLRLVEEDLRHRRRRRQQHGGIEPGLGGPLPDQQQGKDGQQPEATLREQGRLHACCFRRGPVTGSLC